MRSTRLRRGILGIVLGCTSLGARILLAAPAAGDPPPAEAVARAQDHFRRGVGLYQDGDYAAAEVEFRRAYQVAPHHRILYNLGQVAYQRLDYVSALEFFTRYLHDGGDDVPPPRRRELQAVIPRLQDRVGRLEVIVEVPGATVSIDDMPVGASPLPSPVPVNVGRRRVHVSVTGGPAQSRLVDVPGRETVRVVFPLPTPARSAIAADLGPAPAGTAPARRGSPPPAERDTAGASGAPVAWTIAGALVVGGGISAWLAARASRDLQTLRGSYPVTTKELSSAHFKARTTALVADSLFVGGAVMAAIATYLSVTGHEPGDRVPTRGSVRASLGPAALTVEGRF